MDFPTPQRVTPALLNAAIEFVAGFEDDASQDGVPGLLARLRAAAGRLTPLPDTPPRLMDGSLRLPGPQQIQALWSSGRWLDAYDRARGWSQTFVRNHDCPHGDGHRWFSFQSRTDEQGGKWTGGTAWFVTDDFGNLVEVPR